MKPIGSLFASSTMSQACPPDMAKTLFTPFTTTKEDGLGLGLVIAHDIVRDLGGELKVESSERGATFAVKLKKAQP